MPTHLFKFLVASVAVASIAACAPKASKPAEPVAPTAPRDCDRPSRDDQGRPIPLC